MEERLMLKQRLDSQNESKKHGQNLTDRQKKGQRLGELRKKRESRQSQKGKSSVGKRNDYENDTDSDLSNNAYAYDDDEQEEKVVPPMSFEDALALQVKRDEAEEWLYKPDFEKTIKG